MLYETQNLPELYYIKHLHDDNKNFVDYEKKMAALPQAMAKIETKYKIVYRNIEKIRGDKNATCANSLNNLNTFQY